MTMAVMCTWTKLFVTHGKQHSPPTWQTLPDSCTHVRAALSQGGSHSTGTQGYLPYSKSQSQFLMDISEAHRFALAPSSCLLGLGGAGGEGGLVGVH